MHISQDYLIHLYMEAVEVFLHDALTQAGDKGNSRLHEMLAYHMGWHGKSAKETRGKRIRPLLTLLTCSAAGGDWKRALPAAAAVEMVHNFSLIHDDIQDHSPLRRGRPTVWKKWGIAQAINAGDAMFTLAHIQTLRLEETVSPAAAIRATEVLQKACLRLTQGQYMDLEFEKRDDVTVEDYWAMIEGKTAALISASVELGAISASCDEQLRIGYREFGRLFGLAYQVQDDILGIWGDIKMTGKSSQSDLLSKKKTLPILFSLAKEGEFAYRWNGGRFSVEELPGLLQLLEREGGKEWAFAKSVELVNEAIKHLDAIRQVNEAGQVLRNLTLSLAHRQV
jgi:geranylgeranyl diphosphate synthase type I